jgi:hypothetical protein
MITKFNQVFELIIIKFKLNNHSFINLSNDIAKYLLINIHIFDIISNK